MEQTDRNFYINSETWYQAASAQLAEVTRDGVIVTRVVDDIMIGDGVHAGELCVQFLIQGNDPRLVTRLQVYGESAALLLACNDFILALAQHDLYTMSENPTPAQVKELLLSLGYRDSTRRNQGDE